MSTLKNTFFIPPPDIPTQAGPENIFYDFNDGARVLLPEGKWHVRLLDADSDNILFASAFRYSVRGKRLPCWMKP